MQVNYIRGRKARGNRRATGPRYGLDLWNVYDLVIQKMARTNNQSEGWHNRFRVVVGKDHPSLYTFIEELKKEQGDTEQMRNQLALGQPIKKKYVLLGNKTNEDRIYNIVHLYMQYKESNNVQRYIKLVGYNIDF